MSLENPFETHLKAAFVAAAAVPAKQFRLEAEASPLSTLTSPVISAASPVNNSTFQLLQAHGITMLPNDESTTVESAMESGQTVVLTGTPIKF